jgi:hypothetical protein
VEEVAHEISWRDGRKLVDVTEKNNLLQIAVLRQDLDQVGKQLKIKIMIYIYKIK